MSRIRAAENLKHAGRAVFFAGMCLLVYGAGAQVSPGRPASIDCGRWTDSMIVAGKRNLDKGSLDSARQFFTAAYHCGMSRDSMFYFAAELYLGAGSTDSAMTFNMALERGGRFDRRTCLDQRIRIYRAVGMDRRADSLSERIAAGGKHEVRIDGSATRTVMSIDGLTLMPQRYPIDFSDNDTDDAGHAGVYYKWSRWNVAGLPKISLTLNVFTDMKLPTRYSYDEKSDTLMRNIAVGIGAGDFPGTPEAFLTYRARVHDVNGDVDHYLRALATVSRRRLILTAQHETKLADGAKVDDSHTEVSILPPPVGRRVQGIFGLSVGHHFSKSDFYQTLLDTAGFFRPLKIGFVDSLTPGAYYRYYRDKGHTNPYQLTFPLPNLYSYWADQPRMTLLDPLPEHDINASLRSTLQVVLPGGVIFKAASMVQVVGYLTAVEWYAVDMPIHLLASEMDKSYSVIYNSADGKYYLHTNRASVRYSASELRELKHYRKHRTDVFLLVSPMIEKKFGPAGTFTMSTAYIKGYSTLDDNGPVARLNDLWQFSAGWSKEIVLVKQ